MLQVSDLLVPVDFSPCAVNAFRAAIQIAEPDSDITLLHVINERFIRYAVETGLGSADEVTSRLRERAEASFKLMREGIASSAIDVEQMVVVGTPFVEILKIARDLDLSMIVMGVRGSATPAEEVLFGSTAEKVLRGSRVPVLCVPF